MRFRRAGEPSSVRVEQPMMPLIDIVFLLMVFFLLTLKIVAPEGDFVVNMPAAASIPDPDRKKPNLDAIKVRLQADKTTGRLAMLEVAGARLGNGPDVFDRLNGEILAAIGRPGDPLVKDMEVEIDADYELRHEYVVRTIGACSGRLDPRTGRVQRYVEKIRFTPPKVPS